MQRVSEFERYTTLSNKFVHTFSVTPMCWSGIHVSYMELLHKEV